MSLGSLTIDEFLSQLSSSDPTPGGGALAALAGAQAAAMLAMVCNLTLGRPRFAAVEAEVTALLSHTGDLRGRLMRLADADAEAYGAVREAYRLPHATEKEREKRKEAIEAAMHGATDVPIQTAEKARGVLDLALEIAQVGNPTVLPDVAVAAHLATAALRGGLTQAHYNIASLADTDFAATMQARTLLAQTDVDVLTSRVLEAVRARASS
ncbi:MAG: cyclodeaminase/cyclohydrolase family protein [Chloroflexi bacterium]|nr:cyclodeaminase/cyclohydrolase family protein [Chloroflexota bacterium]